MSGLPDHSGAGCTRHAAPAAAAGAIVLALCGTTVAQTAAAFPTATVDEPRAFGHSVGDVVTRTVTVHVPADLKLEEASLPQPGRRGTAIELQGVTRRTRGEAGGQRHELRLRYQVFVSPPEVRVFELPPFTLRFSGRPRTEELRIDAWPVSVAPLAAANAPARRGLGQLRPDMPPPLIDTTAARLRLAACGMAAALLLVYLALVHWGLPWRAARRRPFARAWRAVRGLSPASPAQQRREAFRQVHDALNRTAGQAMFERDVDRFVAAQPRYARVRDDLMLFFRRSREEFFAGPNRADDAAGTGHAGSAGSANDAVAAGHATDAAGTIGTVDTAAGTAARESAPSTARWLVDFCRRCRDIEQGAP